MISSSSGVFITISRGKTNPFPGIHENDRSPIWGEDILKKKVWSQNSAPHVVGKDDAFRNVKRLNGSKKWQCMLTDLNCENQPLGCFGQNSHQAYSKKVSRASNSDCSFHNLPFRFNHPIQNQWAECAQDCLSVPIRVTYKVSNGPVCSMLPVFTSRLYCAVMPG